MVPDAVQKHRFDLVWTFRDSKGKLSVASATAFGPGIKIWGASHGALLAEMNQAFALTFLKMVVQIESAEGSIRRDGFDRIQNYPGKPLTFTSIGSNINATGDMLAETRLWGAGTIDITPEFFTRTTASGIFSPAGVLIHEASHAVAGTVDFARLGWSVSKSYSLSGIERLAQVEPEDAITNAQNWDAYAIGAQ